MTITSPTWLQHNQYTAPCTHQLHVGLKLATLLYQESLLTDLSILTHKVSIISHFNSHTHIYTVCLQMNGAVSKVNKKFISHLTRAKRSPLAAATLQVSHAIPAVRSLVLTAGLRGQFPRWRRSRKRLSVCSVLRCPDL